MKLPHVSETPFDADCLRLLRKLREAEGQALPHSVLLKRMKLDAEAFRRLAQTLMERGEVAVEMNPTKGRTGAIYRLTG